MERSERCKTITSESSKSTNGSINGTVGAEGALERPGIKEPLKDLHYFNTFFFAKLENLGYEKARLNKWTKKVQKCHTFYLALVLISTFSNF